MIFCFLRCYENPPALPAGFCSVHSCFSRHGSQKRSLNAFRAESGFFA